VIQITSATVPDENSSEGEAEECFRIDMPKIERHLNNIGLLQICVNPADANTGTRPQKEHRPAQTHCGHVGHKRGLNSSIVPQALNSRQESRCEIPGFASVQIQEPRLSRLCVYSNGNGHPLNFERDRHVDKFDMRRS
jgi:hypothetical protein